MATAGQAVHGRYLEAGRVAGTASFRAVQPFEVEISPARLVTGLLPD